jgi:hypothetical protein
VYQPQFKTFKLFKPFKPPPRIKVRGRLYFLPRDAGEDAGGGLNDWNFLNDWNPNWRKQFYGQQRNQPQ